MSLINWSIFWHIKPVRVPVQTRSSSIRESSLLRRHMEPYNINSLQITTRVVFMLITSIKLSFYHASEMSPAVSRPGLLSFKERASGSFLTIISLQVTMKTILVAITIIICIGVVGAQVTPISPATLTCTKVNYTYNDESGVWNSLGNYWWVVLNFKIIFKRI